MPEDIFLNTQLALFFGETINRPDNLINGLNDVMGRRFDDVPTVIPVPTETQLAGVPVVQMASTDGKYRCNIARGRVDFYHFSVGATFAEIENDFSEEIQAYFNFFSGRFSIKRIGFISRFFVESDNAQDYIASLIDDRLKRLHTGEVHEGYVRYVSRDRESVAPFELNNFTTIEKATATLTERDDTRRPGVWGVKITRDFNTAPESDYRDELNIESLLKIIEFGKDNFNLEGIKESLWQTRN